MLRTSIYEQNAIDKRIEFSVRCFFPNSRRWSAWNLPANDSLMQISGDLLGVYAEDGLNTPAILVHDLVSLPTSRREGGADPLIGSSGTSLSSSTVSLTPKKRRVVQLSNAERLPAKGLVPSSLSEVPDQIPHPRAVDLRDGSETTSVLDEFVSGQASDLAALSSVDEPTPSKGKGRSNNSDRVIQSANTKSVKKTGRGGRKGVGADKRTKEVQADVLSGGDGGESSGLGSVESIMIEDGGEDGSANSGDTLAD